jgi:hypothetical protein
MVDRTTKYTKHGLKPITCSKCGKVLVGWTALNYVGNLNGTENFKHECTAELVGDSEYDY